MDKDVKELKSLVRQVVDGRETVFDIETELDDNGQERKAISIGHRPILPDPVPEVKALAKARSHVFHSLKQFSEYVSREANPDQSVVLANVDKKTIGAVLNEADETDREEISFEAKTHPLFEPWAKLIGQAIPVLEFSLHVMQYRNAVVSPDGRELALMFSQIKASKRVSKHVGVGPKSLNGVVVELTIGSEKKEVGIDLPESITLDVPLFLGTDPMEVELDLLVTERPRDEELVVFVTAPKLQELEVNAFESMVSTVRSDTGMCVGLGRVEHRSFRTLELYEPAE